MWVKCILTTEVDQEIAVQIGSKIASIAAVEELQSVGPFVGNPPVKTEAPCGQVGATGRWPDLDIISVKDRDAGQCIVNGLGDPGSGNDHALRLIGLFGSR